jgi:hypothetical protein
MLTHDGAIYRLSAAARKPTAAAAQASPASLKLLT